MLNVIDRLITFFFVIQLDKDVEQWPHLNELFQCYRADWVKDENKYGHYESIGVTAFQNQIYEGADTDIETGDVIRHPIGASLNYIFMLQCKMKVAIH